MADEEDIELVRTAYDAFVAGDMEWLNEHLHENIVWHAAGRSSLAGEYRGREEVLASLAKSVQIAMPAFEIHDVAASEDHAVTVLDVTWRRPDGQAFEGKAVQVFHVGGGKVLESWFIPEDQAGLDAFSRASPPSLRGERRIPTSSSTPTGEPLTQGPSVSVGSR